MGLEDVHAWRDKMISQHRSGWIQDVRCTVGKRLTETALTDGWEWDDPNIQKRTAWEPWGPQPCRGVSGLALQTLHSS